MLTIGNFIGSIIGFDYYWTIFNAEIKSFPPILWILIPDCPMSSFLFIGFLLQRDNQRFHSYNFFVFVEQIRGAAITFLIMFNFGSIDTEIVFLGHSLLIIQSLSMIPFLKINRFFPVMIGLVFFNEGMDFFLGTLVQLRTILSMYEFFLITINSLNILLIILGVFFARVINNPLPSSTSNNNTNNS